PTVYQIASITRGPAHRSGDAGARCRRRIERTSGGRAARGVECCVLIRLPFAQLVAMDNSQQNRMGQNPPFGPPPKQGLYDPTYEHDSCGGGFVAHIKGKRSHQILIDAEEVLRNMDHRGACGCEPNTGDGAGVLTAL